MLIFSLGTVNSSTVAFGIVKRDLSHSITDMFLYPSGNFIFIFTPARSLNDKPDKSISPISSLSKLSIVLSGAAMIMVDGVIEYCKLSKSKLSGTFVKDTESGSSCFRIGTVTVKLSLSNPEDLWIFLFLLHCKTNLRCKLRTYI